MAGAKSKAKSNGRADSAHGQDGGSHLSLLKARVRDAKEHVKQAKQAFKDAKKAYRRAKKHVSGEDEAPAEIETVMPMTAKPMTAKPVAMKAPPSKVRTRKAPSRDLSQASPQSPA